MRISRKIPLPRMTKFKYYLNLAFSRSGGVQATIPVRCIAAKSISAGERREERAGSDYRERGGEGGRQEAVGPVGAGGPVSLPRDSNTRRIKPTGNQTFQYPCSCRIYAIKRPLRRRPALLPVFLFSIRLSLSLTPLLCRLVTERLGLRQMFNMRACMYIYIYACTRVYAFVFTYLRESPVWLGGLEDCRERVARMPSSEFNSI